MDLFYCPSCIPTPSHLFFTLSSATDLKNNNLNLNSWVFPGLSVPWHDPSLFGDPIEREFRQWLILPWGTGWTVLFLEKDVGKMDSGWKMNGSRSKYSMSIFALLELSIVFDIISHGLLGVRMSHGILQEFGMGSTVLCWFTSFFQSESQWGLIGRKESSPQPLFCLMQQDLMFFPHALFNIYIRPPICYIRSPIPIFYFSTSNIVLGALVALVGTTDFNSTQARWSNFEHLDLSVPNICCLVFLRWT